MERAERLPSVLQVPYLIFYEGYASSAGERLQRLDLAHEVNPVDPLGESAAYRCSESAAS